MSGVCIKMTGNKQKPLHELSEILKSTINAELISESLRTSESMDIILLTFEKYYFRNGSYASLTVMLTESLAMQTADIIGSGGGEGLLNFSWGANSDFAEDTADILEKYGFRRDDN